MTGVAFFDIDSFQLEEGVVATEYERPAPAPDYPREVHSLNDFDVVSSVGGRNYVIPDNVYSYTEYNTPWEYDIESEAYKTEIKRENTWTMRHSDFALQGKDGVFSAYMYINGRPVNENDFIRISPRLSTYGITHDSKIGDKGFVSFNVTFHDIGDWIVHGYRTMNLAVGDILELRQLQIDSGNTATAYSPAPEDINEDSNNSLVDKINLLLSEPLRSVGDVKDRLFRDSDGLWKVERNIAQYISDGNESWRLQSATQNRWDMTSNNLPINSIYDSNNNATTPVLNSHFIETRGSAVEGGTYVFVRNVRIYWAKPTSVDDLKSMLKSYHDNGNPVTWHYQIRPTIETLDQELQDKLNNLRSFQDSNYVYTVINNKSDIISENLKPTLHAVFKGGGWYSRWKTEDELRKHQAEIDDKADNASTEESINNAIANIQVLQQELEAAATANELDDFIDRYNKDMAARNKDASQSEENLSTALSSISTIEKDLGEMSETWKFVDRFIKNTPEGIVVGNDTTGSYILIKEDRLSFYSNSQEVAFISQNLMEISRGAFVEQIQIAKYQFEESTNNHLTIRYVG